VIGTWAAELTLHEHLSMEIDDTFIGLKKRDNATYKHLYRLHYPGIEKFVRKNSGTSADADDVFQETILVLLDKVPREDFVFTSSIKTYLQAVARNIWMKHLRETRRLTRIDVDYELEDMSLSEWERKEEKLLKRSRLKRAFNKLTRHCFVFLTRTFLSGASREQLMAAMGYRDAHTFDNQKYKCLEKARNSG
jgi:RNA polymerase sigma factor (sigma-70 family)